MSTSFPQAARAALADSQLRRNLRNATTQIRSRRREAIDELEDWPALRDRARRIKDEALADLDVQLERLEASVIGAGGHVHWARDGAEAVETVARLAGAAGSDEAIKVKSLTTDEIELNRGLASHGITAWETDLAELIVQLADDTSSHILVPAIHLNRTQIRDLFVRHLDVDADLSDEPAALAAAAREHLRQLFLRVPVAVTGANFAASDTGTVCIVESEGNGRMCTTLPRVLITVMGIEKVVPRLGDLGVMLQLLARSATGERMNPYTSLWTGVTPGDGPEEFHLVLLDGGRTDTLADAVGQQALRCIRCSACLNACPVYERTGGHAYGSVYPGPIGAIASPQLAGMQDHESLPWASSLCGACYEVCPVGIDIPTVLVHLRGRIVAERGGRSAEALAMASLARLFASRRRYEAAQAAGRLLERAAPLERLPGPLRAWGDARDLPEPPRESFRQWWRRQERGDDR